MRERHRVIIASGRPRHREKVRAIIVCFWGLADVRWSPRNFAF
jgi:hypothetical protein